MRMLSLISTLSSKIDSEKTADDLDEKNEKQYDYIGDDFDKELSIARRYRDLAAIYLKISDYKKAEECGGVRITLTKD